MKKVLFKGCGVALITPFRNGALDTAAFSAHLERLISSGVDALIPCGTTGEPATLSEDEWKTVIQLTVRISDGRIPVIAGTGSNNTAEVVRRAHIADDLGADAQLCVTPYYNKTTQEGLLAHFFAIADSSTLPVILYNVPSRTGMTIQPDICSRLSGHPNIVGIKDASGSIVQALEALSKCDPDFAFYSGEDQLAVSLRTIGYQGLISVTANLTPELIVKLCHAPLEEAGKLQRELFEINRLMFCETSPAPIKAALSMKGVVANELRLPLVPLSSPNYEKLKREMERLAIL